MERPTEAIESDDSDDLELATMGICLPALYTFSVLLGSRITLRQSAALLAANSYTMALILGSTAPIMLLFVLSTSSKEFILLLTVVVFGAAGLFGLRSLWQGLDQVTLTSGLIVPRGILRVWTGIYIFVGTQLAWILRPFIGTPGEAAFFRQLEGNFYQAVWWAIREMF